MTKKIRNVAFVILYDDENRILIQHRTDNAPLYPSYWGFFGGGIKENETPEVAVKREALEELNYKLINPLLLFSFDYEYDDREYRGKKYVFLDRCLDKTLIKQKEGQDMKWCTIKEAKKLKFLDFNVHVLDKIKEFFDNQNKNF